MWNECVQLQVLEEQNNQLASMLRKRLSYTYVENVQCHYLNSTTGETKREEVDEMKLTEEEKVKGWKLKKEVKYKCCENSHRGTPRLRRLCIIKGCERYSQGRSFRCFRHGGGYRCLFKGCNKGSRNKLGLCISHGREQKISQLRGNTFKSTIPNTVPQSVPGKQLNSVQLFASLALHKVFI
eukprot:snap_masked-scaffold_1-processed-gene-10.19-mRNA-1 protein AED:0.22 eAED:1.00 QI:0/-1/0/1/-1/1/1/0/181